MEGAIRNCQWLLPLNVIVSSGGRLTRGDFKQQVSNRPRLGDHQVVPVSTP
jgi:hypothetical protein